MEITLTDHDQIKEIQQTFRKKFPKLKLEFFLVPFEDDPEFMRENLIIDEEKYIDKIRHIHNAGHISINGNQKVKTLEKNFQKNYGMNVKVFRRFGSIWAKTNSMNNMSLAELNKLHEESAHLTNAMEVPDMQFV